MLRETAMTFAAKSLQSCPTVGDPIDGPWDSPGENTGVGGHFLLQCMKVKSESEITQLCRTLSDPMDCSLPGSSNHGIFQEYWSGVPLTFEVTGNVLRPTETLFHLSFVTTTQDH